MTIQHHIYTSYFFMVIKENNGRFPFCHGGTPFLVVMDDLIARPKVWPSSCRSSTAAFRSDAWDVSWANHRSFNEFQWVSCGFMAFHRKKPDEFLFWMAYDGVFVLKQTLSKHVKHQMPAQDWTGSQKWTRLTWCHLKLILQLQSGWFKNL